MYYFLLEHTDLASLSLLDHLESKNIHQVFAANFDSTKALQEMVLEARWLGLMDLIRKIGVFSDLIHLLAHPERND